MANIHGLFSNRNSDDDDDDGNDNNRFVGGIDSRGGGRYVKMQKLLSLPRVSCCFPT